MGASGDYRSISNFLNGLSKSDAESKAYGAWLEQRAITLVGRYWGAIEAVAAALLERQTLSAAEVRGAIFAHFDVDLRAATEQRLSGKAEPQTPTTSGEE